MFRVTREFLRARPDCVFVFGDNLLGRGKKGAAELRDEPNVFGFVTKKAPNNLDRSFYRPKCYLSVFRAELRRLQKEIEDDPNKLYLISQLGSGLANRYKIWEKVISPGLEPLRSLPNVVFLFENGAEERLTRKE